MTVPEFFSTVGVMLLGREHGPLHFRLIFQPLTAIVLAMRVAIRDAREGRAPYFFWAIFFDRTRRPELLHQPMKDVGKVFIVAFVLDVIYELIVYHWVYPGQALIVAAVLAVIPYLLVRGPATRIALRFLKNG